MSAMHREVSINNGPGVPGTLLIETEQIDVTLMTKTKPDLSWEYIDTAGHFHAWTEDGKLPTLDTRTEFVGCADDCCEGYDVTVYACAICGETVEPKTVSYTPLAREFAPGRTSWSVEVEQQIRGDRVSIRLTTRETTLFGVAMVGDLRAEGGSEGVRVWTTLHGVGLLGRRNEVEGPGMTEEAA